MIQIKGEGRNYSIIMSQNSTKCRDNGLFGFFLSFSLSSIKTYSRHSTSLRKMVGIQTQIKYTNKYSKTHREQIKLPISLAFNTNKRQITLQILFQVNEENINIQDKQCYRALIEKNQRKLCRKESW